MNIFKKPSVCRAKNALHTDILSLSSINKYLTDKNLKTELYSNVISTNMLAKERALQGESEGLLIIADCQDSGYGRMGRSFHSPAGTGIYLSLLLRPDIPVHKTAFITPAAAVAMCRAIEILCDKKPQIKWVNDIFIDGKKICGILTETAVCPQSGKPDYVILGTGVNVYPPLNGFPDEIKNIAGHICENAVPDFRNHLAAEFINNFLKIQQTDFYDEYKKRCFILGSKINVLLPDKTSYYATALDIDNEFRLKIARDDGKAEYINSGEISIRQI